MTTNKVKGVEFIVPCTVNSLRASRRRAARALRCEEEGVFIDVWLAEGASYLNSPRHPTTPLYREQWQGTEADGRLGVDNDLAGL
jgi:hypothetical protein